MEPCLQPAQRVEPVVLTFPSRDARLRVLARIGSLGCSSTAPACEVAPGILAELTRLAPGSAAMLCALDPGFAEARALAETDWPAPVAARLRSDEVLRDAVVPLLERGAAPVVATRARPVSAALGAVVDQLAVFGYDALLLHGYVAGDGRPLGYLAMAVHDEDVDGGDLVEVVAHSASVIAEILDPVRAAAGPAALLDADERAVALLPCGAMVALGRGGGDPAGEVGDALRDTALQVLGPGRRSAAFVMQREEGGWYSCRAFRCRDGVILLAVAERADLCSLTPRELEVLSHLVAGRSNAEIAAELWVTTRTVKAHVAQILEKLGVASRSGAVARAVDEGLLLAV